MNNSKKCSPEVRKRAVRMVEEQRGEYPSLWAAVESIAGKIGCGPQTLLTWVQRKEVDCGVRIGVTTAETQRVKELEREVKELHRAGVRGAGDARMGGVVQHPAPAWLHRLHSSGRS